jgi:hypothetical protein
VRCEKFVVRCEKFVVRCEKFVVRCEKFVVRCEKFVVRCEKFVVISPEMPSKARFCDRVSDKKQTTVRVHHKILAVHRKFLRFH